MGKKTVSLTAHTQAAPREPEKRGRKVIRVWRGETILLTTSDGPVSIRIGETRTLSLRNQVQLSVDAPLSIRIRHLDSDGNDLEKGGRMD